MATTSGAPGLTVLPTLLARAEEAIELSLLSSARAAVVAFCLGLAGPVKR
jgi:hypothetical protein